MLKEGKRKMLELNTIHEGDCLELMEYIPVCGEWNNGSGLFENQERFHFDRERT